MSQGFIAAGANYWFWWPIHFVVFIALVSIPVRALWALENTPLPWWDQPTRLQNFSPRWTKAAMGTGVTICGIALLMFSGTGLGGFPTRIVHYAGLPLSSGLALLLLVCGAVIVRAGGAPRR